MIWMNNLIAHLLPLVPKSIVEIFARQYIAGETLDHAVVKIKALNKSGITATLDCLGEDPKTKAECTDAVKVYIKAVDEIHRLSLDSGISFKLSHMGLKLDRQFCFDNANRIVEYAAQKNIYVRIDMEDLSLKNDTLEIYRRLRSRFDGVGIVMQAYLRSALQDAGRMIEEKANIRLCKGAYYWEDKRHVYKDMGMINSSYAYLTEKLLSGGCFTAIATHDEAIVFEALKIIDKLQLSKQDYEFQMLYGVREDLRDILLESGHPIRIYVPFGKDWMAYSIRRLKENPKMIGYIFTQTFENIFKKK